MPGTAPGEQPLPPGTTVKLDCGGLSYCSTGGSGQLAGGPGALAGAPFPACCDPQGSGLGTIAGGADGYFSLWPLAGSSQIGSGDTYIERVAEPSGAVSESSLVLGFVFDTTPALASLSDGSHSYDLTYPVRPGDPGTTSAPFVVSAGATGHVVLTLTSWRPQRSGIAGAGEPTFMDIGHLDYTLDIPNRPIAPGAPASEGGGPGACPPTTLASLSPELSVVSDPSEGPFAGALADASSDAPANPTRKLELSLDVTACLASAGISWNSGETLDIALAGRDEHNDNAQTGFSLQLK